mgnify:CR=1 FL=1
MQESNASGVALPAANSMIPVPGRDVLTEVLRDGAQRLLAQAIEAEVADWVERHAMLKNASGRQEVVRNGHHPPRTLVTGIGPVEVHQPRVLDRRIVGTNDAGESIDANGQPVTRFRSSILPPYVRKTKAIDELIPWLYLKGISTKDFGDALTPELREQEAALRAQSQKRT